MSNFRPTVRSICNGAVPLVLITVLTLVTATASAAPTTRIGAREDVIRTVLEPDADTGNLFAVLRYDDGTDDCFSVNLSIDGGATWTETYEHRTSLELDDDIGATIVGGSLYVSYVSVAAVHSARLMRFRNSDGEQDPVYGAHTVFNAQVADTINDVKVCSNVDSFDDHLYFFAISEDVLKYFWSDEDGGAGTEPWHVVATGVSNACCGLDVTANKNAHLGTGYNPIAAFRGTDWELFLWRYDGMAPEQIELDDPIYSYPDGQVSISASEDEFVLTYWRQSYEAKTCVSHSAGGGMGCEVVQLGGYGYYGDLSARHGAGFAMVYSRDNDPCEYRRRDYVGAWSAPQPCSDVDLDSSSWLTLEALPPYGELDYGGVLISSDGVPSAAPYFFRAPVMFSDGFESGDTTFWSIVMP